MTPIKTQVHDDFLPQEEWEVFESHFMGHSLDWHFLDGVVLPGDGGYQFTHLLYTEYEPRSQYWQFVEPIFRYLNAASIVRCKANCHPRTEEIQINNFHTDFPNCVTAIFYANTCDGKTIFEDGTEVESVANRIVVFDSNLKHTGTTCTNAATRVVVNFNYHIYDDIIKEES